MEKRTRTARIDGMDLETGAFLMTLATEGEASDGHILSIKGGQIPERMPMLLSHWNDPSATVGSVTGAHKHLNDSPSRLSAIGQIEMDGEGMPAEVRRDLAHMIDKGHVGAVSIRWDEVPGKSTRRVNLPSDHPYFVDAETATGAERWGMFFEEWRALEGSIVAIGADPGALIGRAEETTGEVSAFWRAMAADAQGEPATDGPDEDAFLAASVAEIRCSTARALEAGATVEEITAAVNESLPDELTSERTSEEADPEPDQEPEDTVRADQPAPLNPDLTGLRAPIDLAGFAELLANAIEASEARMTRNVQALIDLRAGKVL